MRTVPRFLALRYIILSFQKITDTLIYKLQAMKVQGSGEWNEIIKRIELI